MGFVSVHLLYPLWEGSEVQAKVTVHLVDMIWLDLVQTEPYTLQL